jgi:diazepam-binding inhibitor (GABA receptor modulating acyl-CoA-binding protein)
MKFDIAVQTVNTLKSEPTNEEKLLVYGWFKQATIGDNLTEKPSMFYFKETAKWNAWSNCKGTSASSAKSKYIDLVIALYNKYGVQ